MMLEREAPQADLNTTHGFETHAVTLRTASGQSLTYEHCALKLASAADCKHSSCDV